MSYEEREYEWEDRPLSESERIREDEELDARYEAQRDEMPDGATCSSCGHVWDMGWIRATRIDPGEYGQPDCPRCGCDPITDELGVPI